MSETKSAEPKSTAARKKAAVARSEKKKDEAKTVDFHGLTLQLPPELPGTLLFDFADMVDGNELGGGMQMIKTLVGAGQYLAIRAKVAEKKFTFQEVEPVIEKLLGDIVGAYGVTLGE